MASLLALLVGTVYYLLPAYAANMAPVLVRNHFKRLAVPIDRNRRLFGKPILGTHKTWRGILAGTILGFMVFLLQRMAAGAGIGDSILLFPYPETSLWFGACMGFGALAGDSVKSFFKRQVGVRPGRPWIPFDQTDFVLGGILFTLPFYMPGWRVVAAALVISIGLHIAANHIGYYLGMREVKW